MSSSPKLAYRPEIDGLRAIAVLAVVFYHAGLGCPGGYVGVDVFFVISGFLITSLILRDFKNGSFSLVEFWERRARRILPAISVCVAVTLLAGWFLLLPADLEKLAASALAQCGFVANIYFWRTTNYFGGENIEKPLLHTWSLAVEEQFYFILPIVLLFIFAIPSLRKPRVLVGIFIAMFVVSFGVSVWGVKNQPHATFFLLPTRAWELLCGSLVAALPLSRLSSRWLVEGVSWLGVAGIALPIAFYSESTQFPGLAALPPCLGTAAILWVNRPGLQATTSAQLLSLSPVRFIGLISYSLYLWHWPILAFANYWKTREFSTEFRWLLIGASLILAALSWRWIETPFRRRQICQTQKGIFTFTGVATAGLLIFSGWLVMGKGMPNRLPADARAMLDAADRRALAREGPNAKPEFPTPDVILSGDLPEIGDLSKASTTPDFLVWGDSHAKVALPAFDAFAKENHLLGKSLVVYSTPPLFADARKLKFAALNAESIADAAIEYVSSRKIKDVYLVGYWALYQRVMGSKYLESAISETISRLQKTGAKVWVIQDVPSYDVDILKLLIRDKFPGWPGSFTSAGTVSAHIEKNSVLYELAAQNKGAAFLDPAPLMLAPKGQGYRISESGVPFYYDANHLTSRGALTFLLPLLKSKGQANFVE